MANRLDHEKVTKAARWRAGGGVGIAHEYWTRSARGYPPAGRAKVKFGEDYRPAVTLSPAQVKKETVEQVRHAHALNEIEQAKLKAELRKKKATLAAGRKNRAASNAAGRFSPFPTKSVVASGKVQQQFTRGRVHELTVEVHSSTRRASEPPTRSK